ncbi:MAG: hypothetical protein GY856_19150 [bacterium]|nr:hypothetical protein [bacterium]
MFESRRDCRRIERRLRERALSESPDSPVEHLDEHLERCDACRRYASGLRRTPELFHRDSLYSPALRRRTLAAVAEPRRSREWKLVVLLVPLAVLTPLVAFAAPTWLVSLALSRVVASTILSLVLSFLVVHAAGAFLVTLSTATLLRRYRPNHSLQEVFHG